MIFGKYTLRYKGNVMHFVFQSTFTTILLSSLAHGKGAADGLFAGYYGFFVSVSGTP